jgi:hypothetical protein
MGEDPEDRIGMQRGATDLMRHKWGRTGRQKGGSELIHPPITVQMTLKISWRDFCADGDVA